MIPVIIIIKIIIIIIILIIIIIIIKGILASYDEVYYSWHNSWTQELLLEIISPAVEQLLNRNLKNRLCARASVYCMGCREFGL